jgi:hypothetical protein
MTRKKVIVGGACVSAVCLGFFGLVWAYSEMAERAKFSTWAENEATDRQAHIHAEIKEGGAPTWAGEYYKGDGMGENVSLRLAAKAGFVFEWHGCMGLYDRNYGSVTFQNSKIRLSFTFPNERRGFRGLATEFIPISWGSRTYLIPPEELVEFCNSVNTGDEPRKGIYGRHLLRCGDENKAVQGWPAVPAEFQPYLLTKAIQTEIVAVGTPRLRPSIIDFKFKDTPLTLKGGTDIGLRTGMELHFIQDYVFESIVVGAVSDHTAEGLMRGIGEESRGPEVGWKLSTSLRETSRGGTKEGAGSAPAH